jgi:hypothetical protein
MTPEQAQHNIDRLKEISDDDERAHSFEDEMYINFVNTIADLDKRTDFTFFDLAELINAAKIIVQSRDLEFARWCA